MNSKIDEIASSVASQDDKFVGFIGVIESIEPIEANEAKLQQFITKMLSLSYGGMNAVFEQLLKHIQPADESSFSTLEESILRFILTSIEPLILSFYSTDQKARSRLADIYQNNGMYTKAASVLQERLSIIASSSTASAKNENENEKFELYVRIMRNYLEADQPENASTFLSKAQYLRPQLESRNEITDIHFQLSQARILDSTRKFLDAANRYYNVSKESLVDEADRLACLGQAVSCSILGSAGPIRSQILHRLYNDERSRQLDSFSILEKVYLDRLLLPSDVEEFARSLQPHQMAMLADGTTVLTRAVNEHNVLSVSKIYKNIGIQQLSQILDLAPAKVEQYTASMISQNRLAAQIDQIDGFIYFTGSPTESDPVKRSDDRLQDVLSLLDDVALKIQKQQKLALGATN
ncbi:hypothetical protein AWJ20_1339 [Sugiyamaella lignohabitans]|uniref:COP9 signalosome complex subunit 4 n=1 Tax=Sugiyamaella lignohabitans TaxID=796027 RepID=A0A167DM58_9ASCO|nr:uncharacterized protein AWJ20_1339 [Sugiyamaella lignohabitans]ANB13061.1 hypothetical protein AWJ20_1339 [Sugiyamaella lignohabitans]